MIVLAMMFSTQVYYTGTDFMALCKADRSRCTSYIEGVLDGTNALLDALDKNELACIPDGTTGATLTNVTMQYFQNNTDKWQYTAASSIMVALIRAYPCSKS